MTSVQFFLPQKSLHPNEYTVVPDVSIEGDDEDDHVVHGPADAEGLGVLVQAVATYSTYIYITSTISSFINHCNIMSLKLQQKSGLYC